MWKTSPCYPFRHGRFSFELEPIFLFVNYWKIADIQAHSSTKCSCRSAIFFFYLGNLCKPLDILTRCYECLLNPRSAIFEESWRFVQIFEYIFFQGNFCNSKLCFWSSLERYFSRWRSAAKYMSFWGSLTWKSLRTTDLEEVFRRQNQGQNIYFHFFCFPKEKKKCSSSLSSNSKILSRY